MKQVKGTITPKGYLKFWHNGKSIFAHRIEWEKHHGEIPNGMQIHHKDGNKLNNHIDNLQLVDPLTHRRLHFSYRLIREGFWEKQCVSCSEWLPLESYSRSTKNKKSFLRRRCIKCHKKMDAEYHAIVYANKKKQFNNNDREVGKVC
jgi:hypothetical protein